MDATRENVKSFLDMLAMEITSAREECENYFAMYDRATSTTSHLTGMPGGGSADRDALLASVASASVACENAIQKIKLCQNKMKELFTKADLDEEEYKVVSSRYIDNKRWKDIGAIIGRSERQAYRLCDSALDKCALVLNYV